MIYHSDIETFQHSRECWNVKAPTPSFWYSSYYMDYIHIEKLIFRGKHGHFEKERRVEQEFAVSVKLGVDTLIAAKSDTLADTIDYGEVKNKIQTILEGNSKYLLEKLAEEIAQKILEDVRIKTVELTIQKPEVWDNGLPGVTISRTK